MSGTGSRPSLTVIGLIVVAAALAAQSVSAGERPFRPAHEAGHALVLRPHGTDPAAVDRAHVTVRWRGLACMFGTFSAANPPGPCWRPYSDQSPFNTPVAGRPAPGSARVVARLMDFSPTPGKLTVGNADTAGDWSHPLYFSAPDDPVFRVHCAQDWGACEVEGMRVAIPDAARAAGGGDAQLAVVDQASGWEYDFWQVRSKPAGGGTLIVGWGGRTRVDPLAGDGLGSNATGAHFGLAAGMIRPAELAAGEIDHALFMVVKCTDGTSVFPAGDGAGTACSRIGLSNEHAPAMGQRFHLDMTEAEIAAQAAPAWQKTILRAMARYGMYVGDTGGSGWGVMLESGSSYTSFGRPDPWARLGRLLGVPRWHDAATGRTVRVFDFADAANWGARLRVSR